VNTCAEKVGGTFIWISDLNGKRSLKLILRIFRMTNVANFFSVSRQKFLVSLIFVTVVTFAGCGTSRPSQTSLSKQKTEHVQQFYGLLLPDIHSISAGRGHTCAIDGDRVKCWGANAYGQTNVPAGLKNPRSVSAGENHTCAIDDEGIKCWGRNHVGQTEVLAGLKNPRSVSAGAYHTCAIDDEGVKCWGDNHYGQTNVPVGLKKPLYVSAGSVHTCVIDDEGVKCWGYNAAGQTNVPAGLKNPRSLSAGGSYNCVIDDEGVKCWGYNENGETNILAGLKNPRSVSAGYSHTCAIDDEGVKCWADNHYGQTNTPEGVKNPRSIGAGGNHTCAIDDEGIKCWGNNGYGQTNIPQLEIGVQGSDTLVLWPQKLSQFTVGDKHHFFCNILNSIFSSLPQPATIDSKENLLLVYLMTRYISEFPSDYFRKDVSPKWLVGLKNIEKKTGIKSVSDIPQTPGTLTVAVKLLNAAFIAVKPMLSSPEQREVDDIVLKINASLSGVMTQAAARGVVKEIRKHQTLMTAIAASDAVHMTSVVVDDASHWILKE
jgi:alpha-tubulin suppressor-like RCC1 family protein